MLSVQKIIFHLDSKSKEQLCESEGSSRSFLGRTHERCSSAPGLLLVNYLTVTSVLLGVILCQWS